MEDTWQNTNMADNNSTQLHSLRARQKEREKLRSDWDRCIMGDSCVLLNTYVSLRSTWMSKGQFGVVTQGSVRMLGS